MPNELNRKFRIRSVSVIIFGQKEVRAVRSDIYDFDPYRFSDVITSGVQQERCDVCDDQNDA